MAGPGTTFAGPLISGTKKDADGSGPANTGLAILRQQVTVNFTAGSATTDVSLALPSGAQIVDILSDTVTAWNTGGTTPAAALTVGLTSGGADFASGVSVLATGRVRPTFTAAQLSAMANLGGTGQSVTVHATVTQSAVSGLVDATAGSTIVTILYAQTVNLTAGTA